MDRHPGRRRVRRGESGQRRDGELLERFAPTTGLVAGLLGLLLAGVTVVYALVALSPPAGTRVALAAVLAAVLVWTTQLRPRALAYREVLLIRGSLRDVRIPWVSVQEVTMGQTLNVRSGGRRYVCVGIGRSLGYDARQQARSRGRGGLLGAGRAANPAADPAAGPAAGHAAGRDQTYQSFVLTRINDLVAEARAREPHEAPAASGGTSTGRERFARSSYAVPELVALGAAAAALLVTLVSGP